MRWVRILLFVLIVACVAPVVPVAIASWIANRHGCALNEGGINPCVIDGVDYGHDLYTMGMMGWLLIATLPLAVLIAVLWVVIEVVRRWRTRKVA